MRLISLLSLSALLLFVSCLDKIDLEVPKGLEDSIVIRGELVKGTPSQLKVYLDRVFNFDLKSLLPLNARSVLLIDEEGNQLDVPEFGDGFHQYTFISGDPFDVDFGKKYFLRVATFDGRVFESSLEELMPLPEKATLKSELSSITVIDESDGELEERPVIQFSIDAPVTLNNKEENARLFWTAERTYQVTDNSERICYITINLDFDNIHVLDGTLLDSDAEDFPLSNIPLDYELGEGYYYSVYQKSLTKGAFDYWNQTKQIIERKGNLFEAPAGRVVTNFKNINDEIDNVFGYFTAYAQDTVRVYVGPEEFDTAGNFCPPSVPAPPGGGCPVPVCCDCASVEGSTIFRPSFW